MLDKIKTLTKVRDLWEGKEVGGKGRDSSFTFVGGGASD